MSKFQKEQSVKREIQKYFGLNKKQLQHMLELEVKRNKTRGEELEYSVLLSIHESNHDLTRIVMNGVDFREVQH